MSNLPRQRLLAFLQSIAFTGAQMIWVTAYVSFSERLGLSISQVLVTFSLGSALFLVGSPYWANISETWGRARVLRISMTALWVSFTLLLVLCTWAPSNPRISFAVLVLSRCIYGFMASAIPAVTQAVHNDHTTAEQSTRAMISHSLSLNAGRIMGLLVVLACAGNLQWSLGMFSIFLTAILFLTLAPFSADARGRVVPAAVSSRSWSAEFRQVRWIVALAFVAATFGELLNSSLATKIKAALGMSGSETTTFTASLLLFACIGVAIIQIGNRAFAASKNAAIFYAGLAALAMGTFIYGGASTTWGFWGALAFFIVGLGVVPPYYLALLRTSEGPTHYGKRAGLVSAAHTVGSASGVGIAALAAALGSAPLIEAVLLSLIVAMAVFSGIQQAPAAFKPLEDPA